MKKGKSSPAKRVGKPWQKFERLIAGLEAFLSPRGAVVIINDKIDDLHTGTPREVDCSIRYRVGSSLILIVIECRDRASKQDVLWIEQLSTKKKRIGADAMIGVSSSGFSSEALSVARIEGVKLRKIDNINPESLIEGLSWAFKYEYYQVVDNKLTLEGDVSEQAKAYLDHLFMEQKEQARAELRIFHNQYLTTPTSSREIFEFFLRLHHENVESSNPGRVTNPGTVYRMQKKFSEEWYIIFGSEKIELLEMDVSFTLHTTHSNLVPNQKPIFYRNENGDTLAESHSFRSDTEDALFGNFTFRADPDLTNFEMSARRYDGFEVQFTAEAFGSQ